MTWKKISLYLVLFIGIDAVLFGLLYWGKERAEQRHVESVLVHQQGEYDSNLAFFGRLASLTAQGIFMRADAVALFAEAAKASGPERDRRRQALYRLLLPSYKNLGPEYFRQVLYHFADGTCFLRMDKPDVFGDQLFDIRPSVRIANTEHRYVEGFETGRFYHAFRHVFPVQQDGQHLGTVEVSTPFYAVSKAMQQVFPEEYFLILKKDLLLQKLEPSGLENYVASTLVAGYLQEKADLAAHAGHHDHVRHLDPGIIARINKAIKPKVAAPMAAGKPFAQNVTIGGQDYLVAFLPVVDVSGQVAGFLLAYGTEPPLAFIRYGFIVGNLLGTTLLLLLLYLHIQATRKIAGQLSFQRQLMEAIPIPVCLKDLHGVLTRCNQAFADLFQLPMAKILGQQSSNLLENEAAATLQDLEARVIASGKRQQAELHLAHPDHGRRDLLVVKAPFVDAKGRVVGVIGSAVDITEQRLIAREIAKSHAELDQIFNTAANGMRVVGLDYTVLRANTTFYALTGLTAQEVVGRKCYEVFPGLACQTAQCPMTRIMQGKQRLEAEATKVLHSGRKIDCLVTSMPYYDQDGEFLGIIEDFKDISRYKELEKSLRETAITDELTGLFNRRGFLTLAEKQLGNALRAEHDMFLIFADLDNMKEINDTLGHETGDLALASAAALLRDTFRQADLLARLGGDEFAVFISCKPGTDSEQAIVARLEANIAQENRAGTLPFPVAISFGVVQLHRDETLGQVIIRADRLMYDNKISKKGGGPAQPGA